MCNLKHFWQVMLMISISLEKEISITMRDMVKLFENCISIIN